jgi:hypothetical protein
LGLLLVFMVVIGRDVAAGGRRGLLLLVDKLHGGLALAGALDGLEEIVLGVRENRAAEPPARGRNVKRLAAGGSGGGGIN